MKSKRKGVSGRAEIDYAEAVDSYAAAEDSDEDDEEEHPADDSDSEQERPEDKEQSDDDDEESDNEESSVDEQEDEGSSDEVQKALDLPSSATGEQCTFDLRNLLAMNSHQVASTMLYKPKTAKGSKVESNITIPPERMTVQVDESHLLEKATDGCAQLLGALWQLPMEKSDAGPMVALPSYFETKLPRALPPPPPKQETKWEKFAKERGIALNKEKRSRKVWDEATGSWMYRHGYEKANNDAAEWPIMEVKGNEDPYEDPWERMRDAKKKRVGKNTESRLRNQERAGTVPKGTATRVMKNLEKTRQAGKSGGNLDRDKVPPSGVPVDLKPTKAGGAVKPVKRGKASTVAALKATQVSTASLGKFDKMRDNEPERKKAQANLKKRKFESATDRKVVSSEAERGLKVLKSVISGGGAAREKAKRNGSLAKGETAYDYEYNDGLGASSFRKKKGRAGAGKMKKLTKKRVK